MTETPKRGWFRGWRKWSIVGFAGFLLLGVGSVELTSQSWFCNSCHIMNPYYDSWKSGAHKDVECVKCHISPGMNNFLAAKFNGLGQVVDDVLSRTTPKPAASVSQLSCTRSGCHSIEKVKATEKAKGNFKFKHEKHLELEYQGITLACGTCHSHVKGDEHFIVNTGVCLTCHLVETDPTQPSLANNNPGSGDTVSKSHSSPVIRMAVRDGRTIRPGKDVPTPPALPGHVKEPSPACDTCHAAPENIIEHGGLKIDHAAYQGYGAACESCHRGTTAVPDPIEDGRCLECHAFGVERITNAEETHKVHLAGRHKIECLSCHGTIRHGPAAQLASLEQFDCRRCHVNQHGVQRGTYAAQGAPAHAPIGENGTPYFSPMFLAHVDCTGCHIDPKPVSRKPDSGATVARPSPAACDRCHKPGLGEKMIPLWQKGTHALYDALAAELQEAEGKDPNNPALPAVRRTLELIRLDGSWGVHNPKYTQKLLEDARAKLSPGAPPTGGGS